jgi:hypothetical protein
LLTFGRWFAFGGLLTFGRWFALGRWFAFGGLFTLGREGSPFSSFCLGLSFCRRGLQGRGHFTFNDALWSGRIENGSNFRLWIEKRDIEG